MIIIIVIGGGAFGTIIIRFFKLSLLVVFSAEPTMILRYFFQFATQLGPQAGEYARVGYLVPPCKVVPDGVWKISFLLGYPFSV